MRGCARQTLYVATGTLSSFSSRLSRRHGQRQWEALAAASRTIPSPDHLQVSPLARPGDPKRYLADVRASALFRAQRLPMHQTPRMELVPESWARIFALGTPLLELLARGTALYLGILVLMRFMPRRTGGELATMDLVFLLLIAEGASHALGEYTSVADGLIVVGMFMAWSYLLNLLSFHSPLIERLVSAPPLLIVKNGRMLRRPMRSEFLTEEELMDHLRQQGVERIEDVKAAYVEGEGKITVLARK